MCTKYTKPLLTMNHLFVRPLKSPFDLSPKEALSGASTSLTKAGA